MYRSRRLISLAPLFQESANEGVMEHGFCREYTEPRDRIPDSPERLAEWQIW
jgi:hypothetical protein